MLTHCPDCKQKLHEGQHKYADGLYNVKYCKKCGFREEKPTRSEASGGSKKAKLFSEPVE